MSLEDYINESYRNDKRQLKQVVDTIHEVALIFQRTACDCDYVDDRSAFGVTSWPYKVTARGKVDTDNLYSPTTHSMILLTLDALETKSKASILIPDRIHPLKLKYQHKKDKDDYSKLKEVKNRASAEMVAAINQHHRKNLWTTKSATYGHGDLLTITWHIELALRWIDAKSLAGTDLGTCISRIVGAAGRTLAIPTANGSNFFDIRSVAKQLKCREVEHPFTRLRYVHLVAVMEKALDQFGKRPTPIPLPIDQKQLDHYWDTVDTIWFERRLHQHLAYWGVGDPRFDPAQLAFSLEGVLQHDADGLSPVTVEHVFNVLSRYQEREPCWRPVAPFMATDRGLSLFPLSAEVANSILRSCEILDRNELAPLHFAKFERQMWAYVSWLLARIERFTWNGNRVAGWHSDYAQERDTIHLWQTSQVLLFLLHFASLLQRKIAADGLNAANITPKNYTTLDDIRTYWSEETVNLAPQVPASSKATAATNPAAVNKKEPAPAYSVLKDIFDDFVRPRLEDSADNRNCSFMLYGPPGTGKTTVAEQISVRLNWPLIIITVSDFLAQGAAEMEARAKMIFSVLCEQHNAVILFDEIDQLLLDRNSRWYQAQDDVFKFMTPGMLTKLQDLRDAKRSVFIVATNYFERIDGAIKRRGRIDEHFLLSLPDWKRRRFFIAKFLIDGSEDFVAETTNNGQSVSDFCKKAAQLENRMKEINQKEFSIEDATAIAVEIEKFALEIDEKLQAQGIHIATVQYGYSDLRKLVPRMKDLKHRANSDAGQFAEDIRSRISDVDPSVELRTYRSRFVDANEQKIRDETPIEEFSLLMYLWGEIGKKVASPLDAATLKLAAESIADKYKTLEDLFDVKVVKDVKPKGHPKGRVHDILSTMFKDHWPTIAPKKSTPNKPNAKRVPSKNKSR
jgi:hypothetical protein